jgi:selenide,water dikinase
VAATNALSDIYSMGGRPLLALNIVCWNPELPSELLDIVLAAGAEVVTDAGAVVAGGHSVVDAEPKFGLAVVGEADPGRLLRNSGLRDGDALILSKPLGFGIATTAFKRDAAPPELLEAAVYWMCQRNEAAASVALENGATGATDVTGFGLLGHLHRMAAASGVEATIDPRRISVLDGVMQLIDDGVFSGGGERNIEWVAPHLGGDYDPRTLRLLADPQTSGGLLFGVSPDRVEPASAALVAAGCQVSVLGEVRSRGEGGRITVAAPLA